MSPANGSDSSVWCEDALLESEDDDVLDDDDDDDEAGGTGAGLAWWPLVLCDNCEE